MSLSTQILCGLILGIGAGIFFGEPMGQLGVVGEAFVRLLQMTVLPYVVVSLVLGLGSLTYRDARVLATQGGLILLGLWLAAFAFVRGTPLIFPTSDAGTFFSTTAAMPATDIDLLALYIPSNPFHALANALVPSVVLFSIALGMALTAVDGKEGFLRGLRVLSDALMRMTTFVVRLTPIGVFAIGASQAGTLTVGEFARIQVYVVTYAALSLVMAFWVLPALVMAITPIRYRDVVGASKDALVTAFATSSEFVVLPILALRGKELLSRYQLDRPGSSGAIDIVVPVSFNFPHVAKVLSLSFIVFAGWFSGAEIEGAEWPQLGMAGVASMFASVNLAVPFLLGLFRIPEDMFQLFVATGVVNAHFGALLAAMHVLTLTLLVTCARTGLLTFRWRRFAVFVLGTAFISLALVGAGRLVFERGLRAVERPEDRLETADWTFPRARAVVHDDLVPPLPDLDQDRFRIDVIRERGSIRVGFRREGLPFSFLNGSGQLAGFDVEMAHSLARSLDLSVEFVPIRRSSAPDLLAQGVVDVVMAGVPLALELSRFVEYSDPYMDLHPAFLVKDHQRSEFRTLNALLGQSELRIAAIDDPYSIRNARGLLPEAEIVPVASPRVFLEEKGEPADAMLYAAEIAWAWSLRYPAYAVVIPEGTLRSLPLAYLLPRDEPELLHFINDWIQVKKRDGGITELHDRWVLGRSPRRLERRWSIARDVFGWFSE